MLCVTVCPYAGRTVGFRDVCNYRQRIMVVLSDVVFLNMTAYNSSCLLMQYNKSETNFCPYDLRLILFLNNLRRLGTLTNNFTFLIFTVSF